MREDNADGLVLKFSVKEMLELFEILQPIQHIYHYSKGHKHLFIKPLRIEQAFLPVDLQKGMSALLSTSFYVPQL